MMTKLFLFMWALLLAPAAFAAPGPPGAPWEAPIQQLEDDLADLAATVNDLADQISGLATPPMVVVTVNCGDGDSISDALLTPAKELVVEFAGTCVEDVRIERGNLTIRGIQAASQRQRYQN